MPNNAQKIMPNNSQSDTNDADDFTRIDDAFLDCLAETRDVTRIFQVESVNICTHWMPSLRVKPIVVNRFIIQYY